MKAIDSILKPDARSANFICDPATGEIRPMQIGDLHSLLQPIELPPHVPCDIRNQFDIALDTFLYSWFSYELVTVAERQGYSALEMALREKLRRGKRTLIGKETLMPMLQMALKDALLQPTDIELAPMGRVAKITLIDVLSMLRNELAHGGTTVFPDGSLTMLRLCSELIQKLFPA